MTNIILLLEVIRVTNAEPVSVTMPICDFKGSPGTSCLVYHQPITNFHYTITTKTNATFEYQGKKYSLFLD